MLDHLLAALAAFAVLAAAFLPLERLLPARPQPVLRRDWHVDLLFFAGQYLVWSGVALTLLTTAQAALALPRDVVVALGPSVPLARAAVAVVAGDVLVYWFHRACHRFEWLWRFHAVHHSSRELDWLAAHREHPVDGLLTQLCQNLPGILLGIDFRLLAGLAVFRSAWGIFIHSNVHLRLGPLALLLGSPELHHWHHARVARTAHNFANLAPWLDLLFRTYHCPVALAASPMPASGPASNPRAAQADHGAAPPTPEGTQRALQGSHTYPLGLTTDWPRGYLAQLLRPLAPAALARRLDRPSA